MQLKVLLTTDKRAFGTMSVSEKDLSYECKLTLNLPSEQHLLIMKSVLEVDEELSPERLTRSFQSNGTKLIV